MNSYRDALRWIVLPFAALSAWYVALAAGILCRLVVESVALRYCQDKEIVSDGLVCFDPWFDPLLDVALYVGAGFAAFLILVSCVGIAPSHKRTVAKITYLAGSIVAACMGIAMGDYKGYLAMTSAVLIGALTTIWLSRKHARARAA